jgi:hypothetical protein
MAAQGACSQTLEAGAVELCLKQSSGVVLDLVLCSFARECRLQPPDGCPRGVFTDPRSRGRGSGVVLDLVLCSFAREC